MDTEKVYRVTDMDTKQSDCYTGMLDVAVFVAKCIMYKEVDSNPRFRVCIMQDENVVWSEDDTFSRLEELANTKNRNMFL